MSADTVTVEAATGRAPSTPAGAAATNRLAVPLGSLGLLIFGLAVWQLFSELIFVIPSVPATFKALGNSLGDGQYRSDLVYTVRNIGLAFAIGISVGALIGMALGYFSWLRRSLEPLLLALYAVPKIIVYPLILPILLIGTKSQVAMGAAHAFFPMMIMVSGAIAGMPPVYRKLGRSLGASPLQMMFRITLPAIRRSFLTGMRLGISLATIGVILAEFFLTEQGVGRIMKLAYNFAQYDKLLSTVMVLFVLSILVSFAIWSIERRLPEERS